MLSIYYRIYFYFRFRKLRYIFFNAYEQIQKRTLEDIIQHAKKTNYFKDKKIEDILSFKNNCPLIDYDNIEHYIQDIIYHNRNELCAHKIIGFSKSSGTTSRSKLIPITQSFLNTNYSIGKDMLAIYFHSFPNSRIVFGKNFSLTGSFVIQNNFVIGDISALFAYFLSPIYKLFRTPNLKIATISDWNEKLKAMLPILKKQDVRWIAGVPSWMRIVIDSIENEFSENITSIWKNLEVFFHGGVSMSPFVPYFKSKMPQLQLWQTYNASEGFFGLQYEKDTNEILLLPHSGNYYEFISYEDIYKEKPELIELSALQIGKTYELIISNNTGLYRYRMGDLIQIKRLSPPFIEIVGRTKNCINAFGEELMVQNTEQSLTNLKSVLDFEIYEYTVAPIFQDNGGYHRWLIEFSQMPNDLVHFSKLLDSELRKLNSDYDAKRYDNIILKELKIEILPKGSFQKWLSVNQRLNVQSKIPKLWKDETIQNQINAIVHSPQLEQIS